MTHRIPGRFGTEILRSLLSQLYLPITPWPSSSVFPIAGDTMLREAKQLVQGQTASKQPCQAWTPSQSATMSVSSPPDLEEQGRVHLKRPLFETEPSRWRENGKGKGAQSTGSSPT